MVKGHFISTLLLLSILGLGFIIFLTIPIMVIVPKLFITNSLLSLLQIPANYNVIPHLSIQTFLTGMIEIILFFLLYMFTLPLRTIIWTLWYKKLAPKYHREIKKRAKILSHVFRDHVTCPGRINGTENTKRKPGR